MSRYYRRPTMSKAKKQLTDQQKIEIVEKYQTGNYTCASLGREYGRATNSINSMLRIRGVEIVNHKILNKTYQMNEHYFDKIDSEEKAYFLGFLYADGCVSIKKQYVSIGLQENDVEILNKFLKLLETNRPLYFREHKTKHPTWQNQYILFMCSKHMKESLIMLGCTPQKTHTLKFPNENQVPLHLVRHFVRGFFDGDGSFSYTQSKDKCHRLSVDIVGNFEFLNKLKELWNPLIGINSKIYKGKRYPDNIVSLTLKGRGNVLKLLNWLYGDSSIYLERKYLKFKTIEKFLTENGLSTNKKFEQPQFSQDS